MTYYFLLKPVYFLCSLTVEALQAFTANVLRLQSGNNAFVSQLYH